MTTDLYSSANYQDALQGYDHNDVQSLAHQTWTPENLCVESFHEQVKYYTSRWDGLCPYIDVTPQMLAAAKKPFIVYALPPEGNYGVPINDKYGLVHAGSPDFWTDERRARKFKELDKLCKNFTVTERVVPGRDLSVEDVFDLGREHFTAYEIHDQEIAGFVDYVQKLVVLIIQAHAENGDVVLSDVSIVMPERDQVYGSFCQWNPAYRNRSPGIYACLLASRWTQKAGYSYYNLGPVGDYGYKALFVTDHEPIFALAMTDLDHPLALDPTSPLHTDFKREDWNQVYRLRSE